MRTVDGRKSGPVLTQPLRLEQGWVGKGISSETGVTQGGTMARVKSPYMSRDQLDEVLGEGWAIEPPVYSRPRWRWGSRSRGQRAYHFVLRRDRRVHLVSIPEGPEIRQFLVDHKLPVDGV